MKITDWYTRTLLTLSTGLLLVVAAELHTANCLQAALNYDSSLAARAAMADAYHPTPVGQWKPEPHTAPTADGIVNVRIVGYRYTPEPFDGQPMVTKDIEFGIYGAAGLPVVTK